MRPVRIGVIEVGADSVRLLVAASRTASEPLLRLREERALLDAEDHLERTSIVHAHARVAREFGIESLHVLVTDVGSANAPELVRALEHAAATSVRVLDASDEARLVWTGAVAGGTSLPETVAVCDVRAHSTTVVVGTVESGPVWTRNLSVGAAALSRSYALSAGAGERRVAEARAAVERAFDGFAVPLPKGALATPLEAPTAHGGLLVLVEAQRRLGVPFRIAEGGLCEGAALALAGELAAA